MKYHCTKKCSFSSRIFLVNVKKSAETTMDLLTFTKNFKKKKKKKKKFTKNIKLHFLWNVLLQSIRVQKAVNTFQ